MTKDELIKTIVTSFSTSKRPGAEKLVSGTSGEAITTKNIFIDKRWNEINTADIIRHNSALGFLTDEAFRYYLPAYMLLLLNKMEEADTLATNVVYHLTLPLEVDQHILLHFLSQSNNTNEGLEKFLLNELKNSTKNAGAFIRRMNGFTHHQGECINSFLLFLNKSFSEYYDGQPQMASDRYWFKYALK
jgi:hypothetical protein